MFPRLRHASILGIVLLAIGMLIFFIKTSVLEYPVRPDARSTVWDYELFLDFKGDNRPTRIEAFLPTHDLERQISNEQFYNGSFGLTFQLDEATSNRMAVWTYRYPSARKVLRYSMRTIGETPQTMLPMSFIMTPPPAIGFESDSIKRQAFIVWTGNLKQRSADLVSYADLAIQAAFANDGAQYADEMNALLDKGRSALRRLELARLSLQAERIPARIANGVFLNESRRLVEIRHWLEYHIDGRDYRYFPDGEPSHFLTIWYGVSPLVNAEGVRGVDAQVSIQRRSYSALALARQADGAWGRLGQAISLEGLPLTTQLVYEVLLTIPVGITILVFLRQFIGIKTLGTFMPVLIGIAFRETALLNGILLFSMLVCLGLSLRFYLERLQLLLVPRLAVVLIFIVMVMAGATLLMSSANQSVGLSISLFPMVILTMTIERMSILWEESSASEAIKAGLGSLMIACVSYLAMTNGLIEHLMYQFPELLLVLMGLCVLMGRYTGLRLSELWRFRSIAD